ncbi:hypothetical protein [Spirosoma validum]|uniref:Uncharacterized protein n=1 Tax=Spirosoma validum TaxID=2771355 RepID=A0A927GC76_9BACT|nr:hypothetical protein [Spirosoma validum]MBD2752363.1 hypothetical protein [Spirosoma validum]
MPAAKRKVVVTFDTYLSILAVVSSFCAIGITFYQAYLQRTQQYASVMPVLDLYHTGRFDDNTSGSAMTVSNFGLGPAFIDSVQYYYRKKRYDNMYNLTRDALAEEHVADSSLVISDLWRDKVIPQDEKIYLYKTSDRHAAEQLHQSAGNMDIVIYYRSVYNERWVMDSRNFKQGRNRKLD